MKGLQATHYVCTAMTAIFETQGAQVPWESSSLVGDFYPAGPLAATAPLQKLPQTTEAERNWAEVKDTKPTRRLITNSDQ